MILDCVTDRALKGFASLKHFLPLLRIVTTILFMSIEVFTTPSTLKCLLTTEFICFFSSATNTLRYMAVYSKYVQNYNLIYGHIKVKMLKISKTISTLKPSLVVLILKEKLTCIQRN